MIYEWEQQAKDGVIAHLHDLNEQLEGPFQIWGVAIVNEETAEGCYIPLAAPSGDVFCADVAKDVFGDAEEEYDKAIKAMREYFSNLKRNKK